MTREIGTIHQHGGTVGMVGQSVRTKNRAPALPTPITDDIIVDAVADQDGQRWFRCGNSPRSIWFSFAELQSAPTTVYSRLGSAGIMVLTRKSKEALSTVVEARTAFRSGMVATRPGWIGDEHGLAFVFGDGTVISPAKHSEIIIAFEPDPKFRPKGDLDDWRERVGPIIAYQPLPIAMISIALVGPLLRFVPAGSTNPVFELVGPPERGKSTMMALAASVWAGDLDRESGGAESWDITLNAVDDVRLRHADTLLALDEIQLAGSSRADQRELLGKLGFKLAATGSKRRFGDGVAAPQVRMATLLAGNSSITTIANLTGDGGKAMASRVVTLDIGDRGAVRGRPGERSDPRVATTALRVAVNEAGRVPGLGVGAPALGRVRG